MEKYSLNKNSITTKAFSQTGKNLDTKKIDFKYNKYKTIILPKKLPQYRRITFYPIKKNYSDFSLTNRQFNEEIIPFKSKINNNKNENKIEQKIKLNSNSLKSFYKDSLLNYNHKKKMNESIQSDLYYYEDEIENKINSHQNYIINSILNQKMKINKKPKIKKNNFGKLNIINYLKNYYGKGIFFDKFGKKNFNDGKLVHFYFKDKKRDLNSLDNRTIRKNNCYKNKNIYEIVELDNKKEKIATKLIIDDNEKKFDDKFDCHFLMKYPENSKNNSIYSSNYSNNVSNYSPSLKYKLKPKNINKNINNNDNSGMNYKVLKLLSRKGFEKMEKKKYKGFTRIIGETIENVKSNRKKYDSLVEINLEIYNKNRNKILNNEL